jgi:hypothetical protein
MSWSKDQRTLDPRAPDAEPVTAHPAKSVMARRWEERLARVGQRVTEQTPSGVQTLTHRVAAPTPQPEPIDAAQSGEEIAPSGPAWLRSPQQALLRVALISCAILLALLYFGGFIK